MDLVLQNTIVPVVQFCKWKSSVWKEIFGYQRKWGAIISWWIPYLFGTGTHETMERFNNMFGDTHAFLPIMNGMIPNTLHKDKNIVEDNPHVHH